MARIGLFICHCGTNIAGVVDVERLAEEFSREPDLVVHTHEHLCTEDGLALMRRVVREEGVERMVVAACTPLLHGDLFKRVAESCGVNRGYVRIANIREQCSWVHPWDVEAATAKAADLIRMAIAAVRRARPVKVARIPVVRRAMVVGGGVAGVTAALCLADMGFEVVLVEREPYLGGMMAKLDKLMPTLDCSPCILGPLLWRLYNHPNIRIMTMSEVVEVTGPPGSFKVRVRRRPRFVVEEKCVAGCTQCMGVCPVEAPDPYKSGIAPRRAVWRPTPVVIPPAAYIDPELCIGCLSCVGACDRDAIDFNEAPREEVLDVGAIIVAVGAKAYEPSRNPLYGYGRHPDVVTSLEYEWLLNSMGPSGGELIRLSDGSRPRRICFVQCVGSRSEREHTYCSRVCCANSVKLAVLTKLRYPDVDVTVFYTDVRVDGLHGEELYRRALELGVRFVRSRVSAVRAVGGRLRVVYEDTLEGEVRSEDFDMVVLAVGMEPDPGLARLARVMGLPLDQHGFIAPYHPKLYPAETFITGVYVAGTCTGPKDITESVLQAGYAAARAAALLQKGFVEVEVAAPSVDHEACMHCGLCVSRCSFKALSIANGAVRVEELACRGCGACASVCPAGAIEPPVASDEELLAMLDALFSRGRSESPLVVAYVCRWCGYAALDNAGANKIPYPTNVRPIMVSCSQRVSARLVLEAFLRGADGVLVIGCHDQDCHYRVGATRFKRRVEGIRRLLEEAGVSPERFEFIQVSAGEGRRVAELIAGFVERVRELGPLGSEVSAS